MPKTNTLTAALVLAALCAGAVALSQPDSKPQPKSEPNPADAKPTNTMPAPKEQPADKAPAPGQGDLGTAEDAHGNKLPILARSEIKLVIEELKIGAGKEAIPGSTVVAHYRGTLKDGTEFDSSVKRGEPATFSLMQVIQGWQIGIPGMKVGGVRKLTIPWQLAYGERGRAPVIPPKADLVFSVELVDVK